MRSATPPIRIGRADIGPGYPAYVVAEAGVNHNGSVEAAERLIGIATRAGADAIKFQAFRAEQLVQASAPTAAYQHAAGAGDSQREMLHRLELSVEDFSRLRGRCEHAPIEFLATPFGVAEVEMLAALGVRALKFASTDLVNEPLLDAGLATGLPMIVSTGAATVEEIEAAIAHIEQAGALDRLVLMHCVSAYPTPVESANVRAVTTLRERHGCVVGYSDHTPSITTGALAVAAGASVIEKHFTSNKTLPGPDQCFSLEPAELTRYIDEIRQAERILGDGCLDVLDCEQEVRSVARSSVVAARAVRAGEPLALDALAVKRPGGGISPTRMKELVGRTSSRDLPKDTPLTWDMLA